MNCVKHRNNFSTSSPRGWYLDSVWLILPSSIGRGSDAPRTIAWNPSLPIFVVRSHKSIVTWSGMYAGAMKIGNSLAEQCSNRSIDQTPCLAIEVFLAVVRQD